MDFISKLIGLGQTPTVLLSVFLICFIGYAIGAVKVKGLNLGTAGVFLFALLFGYLCTLPGLKEIPVLGKFYMENAADAKIPPFGQLSVQIFEIHGLRQCDVEVEKDVKHIPQSLSQMKLCPVALNGHILHLHRLAHLYDLLRCGLEHPLQQPVPHPGCGAEAKQGGEDRRHQQAGAGAAAGRLKSLRLLDQIRAEIAHPLHQPECGAVGLCSVVILLSHHSSSSSVSSFQSSRRIRCSSERAAPLLSPVRRATSSIGSKKK